MISSICAVARLLTCTYLPISGMYPPYAAWWKTTSTPSRAALTAAGSRTSAAANSASGGNQGGLPLRWVWGSRLSRTRTE